MNDIISIAIETSCRMGGVALGLGDRLEREISFDASSRHATHLLCRLEELLVGEELLPAQLNEVYVSAGPGSFTGIRVGVTVARTLGQAIAGVRLVAVPTALAVAENVRAMAWDHLAVVMEAKEGTVYASLLQRKGDEISFAEPPSVAVPQEFMVRAPRPLLLMGEALAHHPLADFAADGVELAAPAGAELHMPTAAGVWHVGRRIAARGEVVDFANLLPIYSRKPEAIRLWELRHGKIG